MDTSMVIGLIVIVVVGFFAWQWYSASSRRRKTRDAAAVPMPVPIGPPVAEAAPVRAPIMAAEATLPVVAGQTEQDLRAKEPVQERHTGSHYEPVTADNMGPASVSDNLRHPEAAFHQPVGAPPGLQKVDVPAGRASVMSTTGIGGATSGAQGFSPEMAQNGGAVVGESVFAFDGMEPTGFASF